MSTSFVDLTLITQGLSTDGRGLPATLSNGGLPVFLDPAPPTAEQMLVPPAVSDLKGNTGFTAEQLANMQASTVNDASGNLIVPTQFGSVDLGSGYNLAFDPDTQQGRVTPAFPVQTGSITDVLGDTAFTYSGADCRAIIEVAETPQALQKPRLAKQILELTTISVSIHRAKSQVRAWGFINPKGIARGGRTIAGTMVMTKFTSDVLMRFLQSHIIRDQSKDSSYLKIDQLPPFNISLIFANEFGYASYQRILGVEFVTESNVYSVQDMMTEQTVTYLAKDFTPLLPLTLPSMFFPATSTPSSAKERTVRDVWESTKQTVQI
jgi:hypothetical protein